MGEKIKEKLRKGMHTCGPWIVSGSPMIAEIVGMVGYDFAILDMEHGNSDFSMLESMIRTLDGCGCSSIVRVPHNDESFILHALDLKADGILVPHIKTREDAEKAINSSKYYPIGQRGYSPYTRAGGYSPVHIAHHTDLENDRIIVGLILEGKEGVDNINEILSISNIADKIDFIYIGAYDLSQDLGIPGQVNDPIVRKIVSDSVDLINKKGIIGCGYVAKNQEDFDWMIHTGMRIITVLPDCAIVFNAFANVLEMFNNNLPGNGEI